MALLLETDLSAASALAEDLHPNAWCALWSETLGNLIYREHPLEQSLTLTEKLTDHLSTFDPTLKLPLTWLSRLADLVTGFSRDKEVRFQSLATPNDYHYVITSEDQAGQDAKLARRQRCRETHDKLCRAMIRFPSTAEEGFRRLAGLHLQDGRDPNELTLLAIQAIETAALHPTRFRDDWPTTFALPRNLHQPDPVLFLLKHTGPPGLPLAIRTGVNKALAGAASFSEALYACQSEEFTAVATKQLATHRGRINEVTMLAHVIDAWSHRQLETDLAPLILRFLKPNRIRDTDDAPAMLVSYYKGLPESSRDQAWRAFLVQLTADWLGPRDRWSELLAKRQLQTIHAASTFKSLMHDLSEHEVITYTLFDFFNEHLRHHTEDQLLHFKWHPLTHWTIKDSPKIIEELLRSPFLRPLESFRAYDKYNGGPGTFVGKVFQRIRTSSQKSKDHYLPMLDKQPAVFGADLLRAALGEDPKVQIAQLLARHESALRKLPPWRQQALPALLNDFIDDHTKLEALPSNTQPVIRWIRSLSSSSTAILAEKILNKPNASLTIQELETLEDRIETLWTYTASTSTDQLEMLFWNTVALLEQAQRQGIHVSHYHPKRRTRAGMLLRNIAENGFISLRRLDHLCQIIGYRHRGHHINGIRVHRLHSAVNQLDVRGGSSMDRLTSLANILIKEVTASSLPMFIPASKSLWQKADDWPDDNATVLGWLAEQAKGSSNRAHWKFLHTIAMLNEATPENTALWEEIQAPLDDEKLSLSARLTIARSLWADYHHALPPLLKEHTIALLITCWENQVPIEESVIETAFGMFDGVEMDPENIPAVTRLLQGWLKHKLSTSHLRSREEPPGLDLAVTLSVALDDGTFFRKIVSHQASKSGVYWLWLALQRGEINLAKNLIEKRWKHLDASDRRLPSNVQMLTSNAVAKALSTVLTKIHRPDPRWMAEAILTTLPDETGLPDDVPRFHQRLASFIKRFDKAQGISTKTRTKILSMLARYPEAAARLSEHYTATGKEIDLRDLAAGNTYSRNQRTLSLQPIFEIYLAKSLSTGADELREQFDQCAHSSTRASVREPGLTMLLKTLRDTLFRDGAGWAETAQLDFLAWIREVLAREDCLKALGFNQFKEFHALSIMAQGIFGKVPSRKIVHQSRGMERADCSRKV